MSQSPLVALLCTLQEAEQFIAHGEETDDLRQQIAVLLRTQLRKQIHTTEAELRAEVARTGQWGDGDDPTVRPTTLEEVLNSASAEIWHAARLLNKLPKGSDGWHHWHGRQAGLHVLLQRCGALPVGPMRRSTDKLDSALAAVRAELPDGFECMPIDLAYQFLTAHGVELARYETPYFQRHLVAGLRKHEHAVPLDAGGGGKLDGEQLAVRTDLDDSASPHHNNLSAVDAGAKRLCVECRHFTRIEDSRFPERCGAPECGKDPVHGKPLLPTCERERASARPKACGPRGTLFTPKAIDGQSKGGAT